MKSARADSDKILTKVLFFKLCPCILLTVHVIVSMKQQAAQVYFPLPVYMEIKVLAQKEGQPMAAWVRNVVMKEIKKKHPKRLKLSEMPTFSWPEKEQISPEDIDKIVYKKDW